MEDHKDVLSMARDHSVANVLNMVKGHNMERGHSMVVLSVRNMAKDLSTEDHRGVHNMVRDHSAAIVHNMANMPDMDVHNMVSHHTEGHRVVHRTDRPTIHRQNTL
jgi:hypothetical protein